MKMHFEDLTPGTVVYHFDSLKSWLLKRGIVIAIDAEARAALVVGMEIHYSLGADLGEAVTIKAERLYTRTRNSHLCEGDTVFCADSPAEWRLGAKNAIAPYWHVSRLSEDVTCVAYLPEWQLIKAADLIAMY